MTAAALEKQPGESRIYDFVFADKMVVGETIASVGTPAQTKQGKVAGAADLTLSGETFAGQIAQVRIAGGTDGELYKITMTVVTDAGNILEGDGFLWVRDK